MLIERGERAAGGARRGTLASRYGKKSGAINSHSRSLARVGEGDNIPLLPRLGSSVAQSMHSFSSSSLPPSLSLVSLSPLLIFTVSLSLILAVYLCFSLSPRGDLAGGAFGAALGSRRRPARPDPG